MVVRFHESFSASSIRRAVTVQNGFTAKLGPKFISSSIRKDRDAAGKVSVEIIRMVSANVMNKTGLKPGAFDVGNNLRPDATMSPSIGTSLSAFYFVFLTLPLGN
ncbi:hypothetical protein HOY82DRAFT_534940 [Tuber indicum]|nr:hypothetical protein HOY82DRAFT_534940 [Tuber indicum]